MKFILLSISLAVLTAALVSSCNTIRGAGRDVEKVGAAVSNI